MNEKIHEDPMLREDTGASILLNSLTYKDTKGTGVLKYILVK